MNAHVDLRSLDAAFVTALHREQGSRCRLPTPRASGAPVLLPPAVIASIALSQVGAVTRIQRLVAAAYGVTRADLLGRSLRHRIVRPRQVAMYLVKVCADRSLHETGRRFGGRDHTTVLHAVRKIEGLLASDPVLAKRISRLRTCIGEGAR